MKEEKKVKVIRNSGKSKSREHPLGVRRLDSVTGEPLAPRSIRRTWKKKGRPLLSKCSKQDLKRAGIIIEEEEKKDDI